MASGKLATWPVSSFKETGNNSSRAGMATTQCHSIYQIDQASKIESGTAQIEITSLPGLAFCLGRISSSRIIGDSSNADFNISKVLSRLSKSYTGTDRFGHFARSLTTTLEKMRQGGRARRQPKTSILVERACPA